MTHRVPGQSTCRNLSSRTVSPRSSWGTQIAKCLGLNSAHSIATPAVNRRIASRLNGRLPQCPAFCRHPVRTCLRHVSKALRLAAESCDRNPLATAKTFRTFTARRRGAVLTRVFGLSLGGCHSAPIKTSLTASMHDRHNVRTCLWHVSSALRLSAESSPKCSMRRYRALTPKTVN